MLLLAVALVWGRAAFAGPQARPIAMDTATATGGPTQLDCPFDRTFADEMVDAGEYNALVTITAGPNVDIFGSGSAVDFVAGSAIILKDSVQITGTFSARIEENSCERYLLLDQQMTWDASQAACESLGANLVSISSAEENAIVTDVCVDCVGGTCFLCWIGGNDKTTEEVFEWIDGTPVTFTSFANDPGNGDIQDCTSTASEFSFRPPGTWGYERCADLVFRQGICESL